MIEFEYNNRKYMPYTYWRKHVAPWRSKLQHKNYYPTYREYVDYYDLCKIDGYMPFGMFTQSNLSENWLQLLDGLRRQIGEKPLDGHEERESLDKGEIVCYT